MFPFGARFLVLAITTFSLMASPMAYSSEGGVGAGGGGGAVVCRNASGKIDSAELFDLFEGKTRWNLQIQKSEVSESIQIQGALDRLSGWKTQKTVQDYLKGVENSLTPIPENTSLEIIPDAHPILMRKGCRYEQLARYALNDVIYFDPEIYQNLSNTDRAAFKLHEAVYRRFREIRGQSDSTWSRRLTATLFATPSSYKKAYLNRIIAVTLLENSGVISLDSDKRYSLQVTFRPVRWARGAVGKYELFLYDENDANPARIANGDFVDGQTATVRLPDAKTLAGKAISVVVSGASLSDRTETLGASAQIIEDRSSLPLSDAKWEQKDQVAWNETVTFTHFYRFLNTEAAIY